MGTNYTPQNLNSGVQSTATLDQNFSDIQTALGRCLNVYGDTGTGTNALESDIDLNSNKIINLAAGVDGLDAVNVNQLNTLIAASATGLIASQIERKLGSDASGQVFTLTGISYTLGANNLAVYQNGVRLNVTDDYTETSSTQVTIDSAITINSNDIWLFVTNESTTTTVGLASGITYNQGGSGAVNRTVTSKLQEFVSVKDFGAVVDGSTDDTTAIQAALDSGASVVMLGAGASVVSSTLTVPNFVSFIGYGIPTVNDTEGSTLLYSGTGECVRSVGTQNVVPFVNSVIGNFRVRKTTQQSTKAAVALISGAGVRPYNIRVDTNDNSYNFKYGFVFDQSEVVEARNLDVQGSTTSGIMTAAYFLTNGAAYTAGNSTNFTNSVTLINCNSNSADYGVLHDGGEGFKIVGGNINGSHTASMRLAGLNSFCIDTVYMEGSSGTADVLVAQLTSDSQSVGAGGGGTIKNCRMASTTTNCIKFENASIQSGGHSIFGNKFGSGRTGAAISTTLADGIRDSWIGPNVNLGGSGKDYCDADVYLHNTVVALVQSQQESNLSQKFGGWKEKPTEYNRVTGSPYVVLDTDRVLHLTNNSGVDLALTLPSGADQDGRILKVCHVLGNDTITFGSVVLAGAGATATIQYDHTNTTWNVLHQEPVHTTTAALEAIGNQINTKASKVEGFRVYNETTNLYVIAAGNANGDVWVYEGTGTTAHTPV